MGGGSITNNNYPTGHSNKKHYYDDFWGQNPYIFMSRRHKHKPRPKHRPTTTESSSIINNNGGSVVGGFDTGCPYGAIVNNNGPEDVQIICLRKIFLTVNKPIIPINEL